MKGRNDEGTSALIGILVATGVFVGAFATLMQVSVDQGSEPARAQEASLHAAASVLARSLLREPGTGWYTGAACAGGQPDPTSFEPDAVQRAGLGEEACVDRDGADYQRISYDKLDNLARASLEANATNHALDYEEARRSLGLEGTTTQFHLRSWPLFPALERRLALAQRDPNLRTLYIGDYDEIQGNVAKSYVVQHTAGARDLGTAALLYVDVMNNGTTTTAFTATFTVPLTRSIVVEKHSGQLAPGAHQNLTVLVNKTKGWTSKNASDPHFEYTIRDPSKTVGEGRASIPFSMTSTATKRILVLEAAQLEYRPGGSGSVKLDFVYDALDGTGDSNIANSGWTMKLLDATGAVVATATDLKDKGGTRSFTISTLGTYEAQLFYPGTNVIQSDQVNVVSTALARFEPATAPSSWVPGDSVVAEGTFLDTLVAQFDLGVRDAPYVSTGIPLDASGDIFPDDNRYLSNRLPGILRDADDVGTIVNYNVLVIGSDVDHNTLTSSNVKYPIRDWVEAGGTLIVLGSDGQAVQWLEPLFHTGLQLAGGGIAVPDAEHPILTTPNRLDLVTLDDHGTAWKFKRDDERNLFTHVVKSGDEDVLGVSDPGAFGLGRVILTSWRAFDATFGDPPAQCSPATLTSECAGLQIMDNFITLAYRVLYVDYGPPIPMGTAASSATDIALVYAPTFAQSIEVYLVVYVF